MISKQEVDRIRGAADIVRVVTAYGLEPRQAGRSLKALCPFHEERTPSFDIDSDKRTFCCFGCGAQGDVFKFVMLRESLKFPDAVRKVAEICGVSVNGHAYAQQPRSYQPDAESKFRRFGNYSTWEVKAWKPFADAFKSSSWAKMELGGRGIPFETGLEASLGWVDEGRKAGIRCRDDEMLLKPWIGFPYIYGEKIRLIKWRLAFSCGKDYWRVPGMEDCLFIDGPPDPLSEVFITEGEPDSLAVRAIGLRACSIPSGAQSYGRSKISREAMNYLMGFRKIYACVDNDEEGQVLLRRLLTDIPAEKIGVVTVPEEFKDANGLLIKGCDRDLKEFDRRFGELVEAAQRPSTIAFAGVGEAFDLYLRKLRSGDSPVFWRFPWRNADRMVVVGPGQVLTLMSSRSGQGKTSMAVQASMYNSLELGRRVAYYTAEVDPVEEMVPMVTAQMLERNRSDLTGDEVTSIRNRCADAEFYFGYDPDAKTWDDVALLLEMAVKRLGIDVVVIDHLDFIIRDPDWSRANAQKAMATRWLKTHLARKYGVLVIVLKQSIKGNPRDRKRGEKEPDPYDQAGPASQVDDADHVLMLHRPKRSKLSEEDGEDIYSDEALLILGKSRRKGKGASVARLHFRGWCARFDQAASKAEAKQAEEQLPYKDD